ncbi:sensor histidine kinase [Phormidesmis priestleyi ULC007]|uniref:histidine kinase n=1 Tax=Phormidesmis priestleyi ULC007 TaxID=1920490 RepID=A0A2T1DFR8_9CYAN|nr:ATP-binding protein [Phormidesmis priestleyi]PSB19360.1 sensor histidine kinase [Phormidesmis priestleyi ULC007]PZO52275.1 MAG: sensor histidine kinase [Phormidesmis priestleyi]
MPTSSEFVELCRSQVALLTQVLGASLSAVYLTEELVEGAEAQIVPIATYPESVALEKSSRFVLPPGSDVAAANSRQISAGVRVDEPLSTDSDEPIDASAVSQRLKGGLVEQRQVVLPLVHEGMVLGLLVTERSDRPWTTWERSQIERVAATIALACVMDQRAQWLDQTRHEQRLLQNEQHDVLDNLLHQFKNPLTALRTFGKLLLRRLRPEDSNREVATSIVRESDRLQDLLQQFDRAIDLEDVDLISVEIDQESQSAKSRPIPLLPAGVLTGSSLTLEACSVTDILQPLLSSAEAIAQEEELSIRALIPTNLPLVWANCGALREVLSNLIDNALKYTSPGGQVHIRVNALDDRVILRVTNTGQGIPPQDLLHLFERHYRGMQAMTEIPGTGLGLAIARRLVEQMHGEIEVFSPMQNDGWISEDSDQPPKEPGATFVVKLAVAEVRDETAQDA